MKIECSIENAPRFADWIKNRGGIAHWTCADLSNASKTWSSPAMDPCPNIGKAGVAGSCALCNGTGFVPHPKEHWSMDPKPEIVTDPSEVMVYEARELKRFHVGVRRGRQGMSLKVTDAGTARIHREVEKAGKGAFYCFDYGDEKNCVIMVSKDYGTLKTWMEKNP